MQVLCKSTIGSGELKCSVCGQGFVMFWERQSRAERKQSMREIQTYLRTHHSNIAGPQAHPRAGFLVPDWNGPVQFSGASILGHAPTWAL
jgi:hypothetical protein